MIFQKLVLKKYKSILLHRRDPDGSVFYFDKSDFDGLFSLDTHFFGDKGQRLSAHFYYRGERRTDRLIIFDHGMGCGHKAYMKEINTITERGYTVFTYDHTGTLDSEGEDIGGFSQSLSDLDRAVKFVRSLDEYKDTKIAVIGHSWGGFSTMNIPALHPDITHVVPISGFISARAIQEQVLLGPLGLYRGALFDAEKQRLPDYCHFDGRESLKDAPTKALIIHSRDDGTCKFENQFGELKKALSHSTRVEFLALDGKEHHPHYTKRAVRKRNEYNSALRAKRKKKELADRAALEAFAASYDWQEMTEQDMDVWNRIFEFIEK